MANVDGVRFIVDGEHYACLRIDVRDVLPVELTAAEQNVAHLVAMGYTNRQIAQRRGVSVYTVGNQLAAIYGKLGASTRHELVAWLASATHPCSM